MQKLNNILLALQKSVYNQANYKIDVYYKENYGVLVVPHMQQPNRNNILFALPEQFLYTNTSFFR